MCVVVFDGERRRVYEWSFARRGRRDGLGHRAKEEKMKETRKSLGLRLEIEELERGRKPGGCLTSSSTSPLCTCPIPAVTGDDAEK